MMKKPSFVPPKLHHIVTRCYKKGVGDREERCKIQMGVPGKAWDEEGRMFNSRWNWMCKNFKAIEKQAVNYGRLSEGSTEGRSSRWEGRDFVAV